MNKNEHLQIVENLNNEAHVIESDVRTEEEQMALEVEQLRDKLLQVELEAQQREEKEEEARQVENQIERTAHE